MPSTKFASLPVLIGLVGVLMAAWTGGCASKPAITHTGFLEDYSLLQKDGESRMVFATPRLASFDVFIVDPVELRVAPTKLSAEDQAEAARHFRESAIRNIQAQGLTVTDRPGVNVARVQIALTDIAESTWWRKIHPVWRSLGAGTGGASMEAEIVDSVTGERLAAVVQTVSGNQFDFTAFSTLADVKSAIDKWADTGRKELVMLREQARTTQ